MPGLNSHRKELLRYFGKLVTKMGNPGLKQVIVRSELRKVTEDPRSRFSLLGCLQHWLLVKADIKKNPEFKRQKQVLIRNYSNKGKDLNIELSSILSSTRKSGDFQSRSKVRD
jgi:hypothetical protein